MVKSARSRSGRNAFHLTALAFAWSIGLAAAAFLIPVYSGDAATATDRAGRTVTVVTHTSATLIQANGTRALLVIVLPVVLVAIAWLGLNRKCARGSRWGARAALTAVVLIGGIGVLGAASIGVFVLPVALLLGLAISRTPVGRPAG